jgi:hypothetical protein
MRLTFIYNVEWDAMNSIQFGWKFKGPADRPGIQSAVERYVKEQQVAGYGTSDGVFYIVFPNEETDRLGLYKIVGTPELTPIPVQLPDTDDEIAKTVVDTIAVLEGTLAEEKTVQSRSALDGLLTTIGMAWRPRWWR